KKVTRSTEGAGTPGSGVRTRFSVSAAVICRSTQSVSPAPARSMALTSACAASHGASSAGEPVSTLTTPPGTSLVAMTSLRLIALSGDFSLATTTTVLPLTRAGATTLTNPSRDDCCGAMIATTPVASGVEMLKYGPLTGLPLPATCTYLSAQPAYQTQTSIAASTCLPAASAVTPSDCTISSTNCARRPSSSSAMR